VKRAYNADQAEGDQYGSRRQQRHGHSGTDVFGERAGE
jgi:hypothetical protein